MQLLLVALSFVLSCNSKISWRANTPPWGCHYHRKLSPIIFLGGLVRQICSFDTLFRKFQGKKIKVVGPFLSYGNQGLGLSRKVRQQIL